MNIKDIASFLTPEEKVLVQTSNNVSSNVMYQLLEKLARERRKVQSLEKRLRKENGNG